MWNKIFCQFFYIFYCSGTSVSELRVLQTKLQYYDRRKITNCTSIPYLLHTDPILSDLYYILCFYFGIEESRDIHSIPANLCSDDKIYTLQTRRKSGVFTNGRLVFRLLIRQPHSDLGCQLAGLGSSSGLVRKNSTRAPTQSMKSIPHTQSW